MIHKHSIEKANNLVGGNLNGSTPSFNHAIANIVKGVPVSHLNNNQRAEVIQMKYLLIGLCIGAFLSLLCWIAEDSIKGTRCHITNNNHTAICPINGEQIHFERWEK